jgi:uncharacterized protein
MTCVPSTDASTDGGILQLSVRGEARHTVSPDRADVAGRVIRAEATKPQAVTATAAVLGTLTHNLAALGGAPLGLETARAALTWSAYSMTTHIEREHNPETGRPEPTGKIIASVSLQVFVRDFALLDRLGTVFARQEGFYVDGVSWLVDDDNPGWAVVRAAAIEAAIRKGRDYAAALGSSLTRIDHLADTGLLGGGPVVPLARAASRMAPGAGGAGDDLEAPSLDPVPQELTAVIEARFSAPSVVLNK